MLHVQCAGCLTSAYLDCSCPPEIQAGPGHLARCPMLDPDGSLSCAPGSGCCEQDHDHAAAANACHGQHADEACPEPGSCAVWAGVTAGTRHPAYDGDPPGDCPGGHCHKDIDGCGVCRPLIITALPGTQIYAAGG